MNYSTTGFPVLHYLPEFAQTALQVWFQTGIKTNLEHSDDGIKAAEDK